MVHEQDIKYFHVVSDEEIATFAETEICSHFSELQGLLLPIISSTITTTTTNIEASSTEALLNLSKGTHTHC